MAEKNILLILYALAGLTLGLWPTLACYLRKATGNDTIHHAGRDFGTICTCLLIIGFGWFWLEAATTPALAGSFIFIAVIAAFHRGHIVPSHVLATLAGLMVAATLPWWCRDRGQVLDLSWGELSAFTAVATVSLWILQTDKNNTGSSARSKAAMAALTGLFVLAAAALSFTTGFFHSTLVMAWHHWSAYIQSSELLLSGARIFNDFPVQYGFGPTVVVASLCGKNCWGGMYYLVGFSTLLFTLLIAAIALHNNKEGLVQRGLIFLLCLTSCLLWTGLPPYISSPLAIPSISGIRYLPVLALVALLFWFERHDNSRPYPAILGHVAWAVAALWSIESAFYATFVWWPYYLLLCGTKAGDGRARTLSLLRSLGILLGVLVALILCFLAGYWLVYKTTPSAYGYFAYALSPPDTLPIEPKGVVWFFILAMALGIATNWQTFRLYGNSAAFRRGFLLLLLAYGVFSYYLGRSHENSISGNMSPFLLLILLNVRTGPLPLPWRKVAVVLLACMLAWPSVFKWDNWKKTADAGKIPEFNLAGFLQELSYENPGTQDILLSESADLGNPKDTARAISYIRQNYGEPVTVINVAGLLSATDSVSVWNAFHDLSNYAFMPDARRHEFLLKTAGTLKRGGWLVIHRDYPSRDLVLAHFNSVYMRGLVLTFGSYYAIRYAPQMPFRE